MSNNMLGSKVLAPNGLQGVVVQIRCGIEEMLERGVLKPVTFRDYATVRFESGWEVEYKVTDLVIILEASDIGF